MHFRPPMPQPSAMRFRLFIRNGWTYVQARDSARSAITTTTDRQAATTWTTEEAERIGARLVRRGLTVDLQPVEPSGAALTRGQEHGA